MLMGIALAHLLALYVMTIGSVRDRQARAADSGEAVFISLPNWVKVPPPSMPERARPARTKVAAPAAAAQEPVTPVLVPVPALQQVEPAVVTADAPSADMPDAAAIRAQARHDLGAIDKDLRGNVPLLPKQRPASFQSRLEQGFAAAHVGSSVAVLDYYTAPDGVIYTRILRNGRYSCRISGTVNFVPGILHNSEKSQGVNCPPADSGWHK